MKLSMDQSRDKKVEKEIRVYKYVIKDNIPHIYVL